MLFNLLTSFVDQYSFSNVFKDLTFRTGLAVTPSLIIVFIIIMYCTILKLVTLGWSRREPPAPQRHGHSH